MENQVCNYCNRSGLLFYPVRYAVACPAGASGVPGLSGSFCIEGGPQDISPAKYVLRTLRSGYLYVYDEKRKRLTAFIVLPSGALSPFDQSYDPVQNATGSIDNCVNPMRKVLPTCFSVEHSEANPAGRVWCGWSNSFWTKRLRSKVDDEAWRKLHMQCIDVPKLLKGDVPHAAEFNSAMERIPHLSEGERVLKAAFGFSGASVEPEIKRRKLRTHLQTILTKYSSGGKAFVVAMNDPVGMANDLSELTVPTNYAGFDEDAHRGSVCLGLLESLEGSVRDEARKKARSFHITLAQSRERAETVLLRGGPVPRAVSHKIHNTDEERDKAIAAEEQHAWDELIVDGHPLLDTEGIKEFPAAYDAALRKFEPTALRLAGVHRDWVASDQLAGWMNAVHDTEDIRSGFAYRESLAQSIGNGANSAPCKSLLAEWLQSGTVTDVKNLLGRALLFNQRELVEATNPYLKASDIPIERILNLYKRSIANVSKSEAGHLIDHLVLTIANIFIELMCGPLFMKAGAFAYRNLIILSLSLTGGVVVRASELTERDLMTWILLQPKRHEIQLAQNRTEMRSAARKAAAVIKKKKEMPVAFAVELDLDQLRHDGRISEKSVAAVGSMKIPGAEQVRSWLGSSAPEEFRLGVVTAVAQLLVLGLALKDLGESDRFNEDESRYKVYCAGASILATISETITLTVEKSQVHPLSQFLFKHWDSPISTAGSLRAGARVAGTAASIMLAVYDVYKAMLAFRQGWKGRATAYGTSAIVGVATAAYGLFAVQAIWPLLIIAVVWAIILPYLNQANLQAWIGRCYFGTDSDKYRTIIEEVQSFNSAVGG